MCDSWTVQELGSGRVLQLGEILGRPGSFALRQPTGSAGVAAHRWASKDEGSPELGLLRHRRWSGRETSDGASGSILP